MEEMKAAQLQSTLVLLIRLKSEDYILPETPYPSPCLFTISKLIYMIRNLNYDEIEEVLQDQVVGRIGCHANGITYIVPVSYAYSDPYVYVYSLEGKKVDIMRENREVCFEVDDIEDIRNWKSVIAWGIFEELRKTEDRQKAWKLLDDRSVPLISAEKEVFHKAVSFSEDINEIEGIFYRISLKDKTGKFENSFGATDR